MNTDPSTQQPRKINITNRLMCDTIAAFGSGFIVAPLITPVDVSVTAAQSGKSTMTQALGGQLKTMFITPHRFLLDKPFLWIFGVYAFTYTANNCIDSLCKINHMNDLIPKLVGVTAVNMGMSIAKDAAFAKYFGSKAPSNVPLASYAMWLIRDVLSIAAAFILPARLSKVLQNKKQMKPDQADKTAQFASPMGLQLVLLPIHLMGLEFYNNKTSPFADRFKRIAKTYPKALPLRFFRMASAYGIGGVNNKKMRNNLISRYEGKNWDIGY